jgi:malonyl-CoA O-methyltransferase
MDESPSFLTKIHRSFSEATRTYDANAQVQDIASERLAADVLERSRRKKYSTCLEVGAGTGLLSRRLTEPGIFASHLITDLSETMLRVNKRLLPETDAITFRQADLNAFSVEGTFDVIAGNMCLQWVSDPESTLGSLSEHLNPGGLLAFSVPVFGSFPEWHEAANSAGVPFTANPLYGADDWARFVSERDFQVKVNTFDSTSHYPSISHFFQSLKRIGASTATHMPVQSPASMRKLLQHAPEPFRITYKVAIILAIK